MTRTIWIAPPVAGLLGVLLYFPASSQNSVSVPVTLDTFIRAETNLYFGRSEFGKLNHRREMAPIEEQDVVRMNRDTLYSSGVFDLDVRRLRIVP